MAQLALLDIPYAILDKTTDEASFAGMFAQLRGHMSRGRCAALVVRKGALIYGDKPCYTGCGHMSRERAAELLLQATGEDIIVSTTGKLSRELFELRERAGAGHQRDFLTVGSMGHASSIALGIALEKPHRRVWCLDGDGAALMHLGAMAVIGQLKPMNLRHVVISNGAHETVGGMPVCCGAADLCALARACGYPWVESAAEEDVLTQASLRMRDASTLAFLEVRCALGARADLGRPTATPKENRDAFMAFVQEKEAQG